MSVGFELEKHFFTSSSYLLLAFALPNFAFQIIWHSNTACRTHVPYFRMNHCEAYLVVTSR